MEIFLKTLIFQPKNSPSNIVRWKSSLVNVSSIELEHELEWLPQSKADVPYLLRFESFG